MPRKATLGITVLILSLVWQPAMKAGASDEAELSAQIESILNLPDTAPFVTLQQGASYLDALCEDEDEIVGKICDKYGDRIAAYGERLRRIQELRAENARKNGTSVTTRGQAPAFAGKLAPSAAGKGIESQGAPTHPQGHPYFPLRRGATWTYRLPSMGAQTIIRKITDASDVTHTFTMEETMHLAVLPMTDKIVYRFELSGGDVRELGHAPAPTPLAVTSGPRPIVLKANLSKGVRWKGCGANSGHTANTECEVVGFVTVTVPAGEYKNVAKLPSAKAA